LANAIIYSCKKDAGVAEAETHFDDLSPWIRPTT